MALLDIRLKQRIVGALVLLALAVIFLPMILNGENQQRYVQVDPPPMPEIEAVPVVVDEPPLVANSEDEWEIEPEPAVVMPSPVIAPEPQPPRLDAQNLPVSWSVQVASLSSVENAQNLQNSLRSQGYSAYVRHVQGMHRVFVGPFIERQEAERIKQGLSQRQRLDGFVVRFKPEVR